MLAQISRRIGELKQEMVDVLCHLISVPAISPDYGFPGEYDRAQELLKIIQNLPFDDVQIFNCPDERAKGKVRPNMLAYYKGKDPRKRLWILTHLDTVPPGDMDKWTETDPFKPLVKDGKVYGRGSEDNLQSLVSSLFAVKALMDLGVKPSHTVILAFVSDEESGNKRGLEWLIKEHPELFQKEDMVLVPDSGNEDGTFIEIAEKSMLWLKVKIYGHQVHASLPNYGLNAHRIGIDMGYRLDKRLREAFSKEDQLYDPPYSTFEPTMVKGPSDSPNIVPGYHEFVFDCRVLPEYPLDQVISLFKEEAERVKKAHSKNGLPKMEFEILHRLDAPAPTPAESPIVKMLQKAIKELRGLEAKPGGIGGGTFAAYFRKLGIPAAVWCTIDRKAHQPNEYAKIENLVEDAKVMAALAVY